jgi:hypothetical protein
VPVPRSWAGLPDRTAGRAEIRGGLHLLGCQPVLAPSRPPLPSGLTKSALDHTIWLFERGRQVAGAVGSSSGLVGPVCRCRRFTATTASSSNWPARPAGRRAVLPRGCGRRAATTRADRRSSCRPRQAGEEQTALRHPGGEAGDGPPPGSVTEQRVWHLERQRLAVPATLGTKVGMY